MNVNNRCCFFSLNSDVYLKPFIYNNAMKLLMKGDTYTLRDLSEWGYNWSDIDTRRAKMKETYPFRVKFCKYSGTKCCGTCTLTCKERCVQDIYTKLSIYLESHCRKPFEENIKDCDYLTRSIYSLLIDVDATYGQLVDMVNQIIGVRQNAESKNKVIKLGLTPVERRDGNIWRLDYAPQPEYYTTSKKGYMMRKVDRNTGKILFREWPDTGLCPYCLPKVTVDRHYGRGYDTW